VETVEILAKHAEAEMRSGELAALARGNMKTLTGRRGGMTDWTEEDSAEELNDVNDTIKKK
jgi:hypothetical protein